jgi:hypothetical protein
MSKNIKIIEGIICQEYIDVLNSLPPEQRERFRDDSIQNTQQLHTEISESDVNMILSQEDH